MSPVAPIPEVPKKPSAQPELWDATKLELDPDLAGLTSVTDELAFWAYLLQLQVARNTKTVPYAKAILAHEKPKP